MKTTGKDNGRPAGERVLITGGSGRIGRLLAQGLSDTYALTLLDREPLQVKVPFPFIHADISDTENLAEHFAGHDTVVHLAADPRYEAPWEGLLKNNLNGTYRVFEAALAAGCRRVVFASSMHAVLGYPKGTFVTSAMPPNPSGSYGATKIFGEALGRYYADQKGLSVLCVRLGAVKTQHGFTLENHLLNIIITERDVVNVFNRCVSAPADIKFAIVHATSGYATPCFDLADAKVTIGYDPMDDVVELARRNGKRCIRNMFFKVYRRLKRLLQQFYHDLVG